MSPHNPGLKTLAFALLVSLGVTKSGRDLTAKIVHGHIKSKLLFWVSFRVRCYLLSRLLRLPVKYGRPLMSILTKPWGAQLDYITPAMTSKGVRGHWYIRNSYKKKVKWAKETAKKADLVIYFIHGGGFKVGESFMYTDSFIHIIEHLKKTRNMNVAIFSVDYRRSPEHTYIQTKEDCMNGYQYLVQDVKIDPKKIIMAGDSAGGNLTASCILALRDMNSTALPQPAGDILISPWIDIGSPDRTVKNKKYVDMLAFDLLSTDQGNYFVNSSFYSNSEDKKKALSNPAISPLHGSFVGICPTLVTYGGLECLQHDIEDLIDALKRDGVPHQVIFQPDATHISIICPPASPTLAVWESDCKRLANWCADLVTKQ